MKQFEFMYHGHSMKGSFRQGDVLRVEPVLLSQVSPGDVVVFFRQRRRDEQDKIVHRVMRGGDGGVVTRGDAMAHEDVGMVMNQNLVGWVYYKERNGCVSRVHGGWIGLCRGHGLHLYWGIRRWMVRTIQPFYNKLKQSGLIFRFWKPKIIRVCLKTQDGRLIQFLYNKRVIARFWPEEDRFECKKPWDLVINEGDGRSADYPKNNCILVKK